MSEENNIFEELNLPGSIQGKQFDVEMERSRLVEMMVEFMMPVIGMAPLMAAVGICGIAIDDLNRIFNR